MGRKLRIEYEGALYHAIQRGNNKQKIFAGSKDKEFLLNVLRKTKAAFDFKLFGYVLMDNHYHLVMQTFSKPMNIIMHQINNTYSKYYNYTYQRTGHVFQGRYNAINVQDENYLASLLRYVHNNPVKAGICKHMSEYPWSSDRFYRKNYKGFVDIEPILDIFSTQRILAVRGYRELMEQPDDEEAFEDVDFIGEENAYVQLLPRHNMPEKIESLDSILLDTVGDPKVYELIKKSSRKRNLTELKIRFIHTALEYGFTQKEISHAIGMGSSAINHLCTRYNLR
jgi:putative transposase